jgi:site-specific DNA-methyltransferase (adenine-specific)
VDAVITDIPYGTTACSWDEIIPLDDMWREVKRVTDVFITTASQPFTSRLVMSNLKWFKHEWIWEKSLSGSPALCNKAPLKTHENICVFSENEHDYYPQMTKGKRRRKKGISGKSIEGQKFVSSGVNTGEINNLYYPRSCQYFSNANRKAKVHPTQKPVELYEYLIKTYTNEGDTVCDIAMGSGTTGVACVQTGRNFIGIEIEPKYYEIAEKRIAEAQLQVRMPI